MGRISLSTQGKCWWAVNRRLMGWNTAFRRKVPAKAGTPTSGIKIDKALAAGGEEIRSRCGDGDPPAS